MAGSSSFGVTYEGLKHSWLQGFSAEYLCFGVTYEGLKLEFPRRPDGGRERFGVTYEGLKPRQSSHTQLPHQVLELPMRV